MSNDKVHDIIIAGAGIAGCYMAQKLISAGFNVMVLEKSKKIKDDSGIVSSRFSKYIPDLKKFLISDITTMKFVSPSGYEFDLKGEKPFAHVIDRIKFLEAQRKKIRKTLIFETVEDMKITPENVVIKTDKNSYNGSIILGCDGALSKVRQCAGISAPRLYYGIMSREKAKQKQDHITVWVNKNYSSDFFAWNIPQKKEWGVMAEENPLACLEAFQKDRGFDMIKPIGAPMPIGATRSYTDRCLLIGDSAGQTKPLTGGGIVLSLKACKHAIDTIKNAFEKKQFDSDILSQYETAWQKDFGEEIRKQLFFRKYYNRLSNDDIDWLFEKFGPKVQNFNITDYDRLSRLWKKVPKTKLIIFTLKTMIRR
ncbi:MAG: NAD(P)/FAD-dependent oxidoreductase [Candidatus Aenigmatarchaeota archaeon]